jgi:uncharacterized membrane protein
MTGPIGQAALIAGTVGSGLIAGLFFGFGTAVMPGLAKTDDRTFVATMQGINEAILNPVFLTVYVAPIVCLGVAAFTGPARPWVIAALILYVATAVITGAGNIPLNDALVAVGLPDSPSALEAARADFEKPWNRLHLARTATVIAAFGCCLGALRAG